MSSNAVVVALGLVCFYLIGLYLGMLLGDIGEVENDYSGETIMQCEAAAGYLNRTSTNKEEVVDWYHEHCTHLENG